MAFCLFIEFVDLLRCHKATCSWQFRTRMIRELNTSMANVWPMGPAMAHFVIPVRGEAPLQQNKTDSSLCSIHFSFSFSRSFMLISIDCQPQMTPGTVSSACMETKLHHSLICDKQKGRLVTIRNPTPPHELSFKAPLTSAYRADHPAIRRAEASVYPSFFNQLKN